MTTETLETLRRERDEARASVAWMRDQVGKCTGMFAPRHVCEPIEGFAERPQDLPRCINALLERLRCAEGMPLGDLMLTRR